MSSQSLRTSLIDRGDEAFMSLSQQIHHMLDAVELYQKKNLSSRTASKSSMAMKQMELEKTIRALGTLPYQLADVIRQWKNKKSRVLSPMGVELEILNEIWTTLEILVLFFALEDFDLKFYNRAKAANAFADLIAVNKLIDSNP